MARGSVYPRATPRSLRWLAAACIAVAALPPGRCDLPVHCTIEHVYGVWYAWPFAPSSRARGAWRAPVAC